MAPLTNDDPPAAGWFLDHEGSSRVPTTRVLEFTLCIVVQLCEEHVGVVPVLPGHLQVYKPQALALVHLGFFS